jgi:alkylated DNA repair dioxygenase AlkB
MARNVSSNLHMLPLFDLPPALPPGFTYTSEFITPEEEQELIGHIVGTGLKTFHFHGFQAKRRTLNHGYDWSFENRTLSRGRPIPEHFEWLIGKVARQVGLAQERIVQLLLIEYPPGAVINWHRDAPHFDMIMGISLHGERIFRLRPHDRKKQGRSAIIPLPVAPRSLYTMHGEARSEWEHSTQPVDEARYSITMRTLR